jgi:hypothetical protein
MGLFDKAQVVDGGPRRRGRPVAEDVMTFTKGLLDLPDGRISVVPFPVESFAIVAAEVERASRLIPNMGISVTWEKTPDGEAVTSDGHVMVSFRGWIRESRTKAAPVTVTKVSPATPGAPKVTPLKK